MVETQRPSQAHSKYIEEFLKSVNRTGKQTKAEKTHCCWFCIFLLTLHIMTSA